MPVTADLGIWYPGPDDHYPEAHWWADHANSVDEKIRDQVRFQTPTVASLNSDAAAVTVQLESGGAMWLVMGRLKATDSSSNFHNMLMEIGGATFNNVSQRRQAGSSAPTYHNSVSGSGHPVWIDQVDGGDGSSRWTTVEMMIQRYTTGAAASRTTIRGEMIAERGATHSTMRAGAATNAPVSSVRFSSGSTNLAAGSQLRAWRIR